MICQNCGADIELKYIRFCPKCGELIQKEEDKTMADASVVLDHSHSQIPVKKEELKSKPVSQKMFINSFSFQGRITRTEYFLSHVIYSVAIIIFCQILPVFLSIIFRGSPNTIFMVACTFSLLFSFWLFTQQVKRSHDCGKSGWWLLLIFYNIYLLIADGDIGPNEYGNDPRGRLPKNTDQQE